jgi:serine/threonine-protein kinase
MVLVYIPAGTFLMGSEDGENDERPVHSVTLDAFWMDQTEVTNGMYAQCVADRVCTSPINTSSSTHRRYYGNVTYANYPVIYVNSHMAATYCEWAGRHLPTEAQWEYAARGGLIQTTYPWGEGIDCTRANFGGTGGCVGDTSVVGSYPPNGYGLYDMAGNVWEWVADRYGSYTSAAVENPSGSVSGEYYALRGGSWGSNGDYLRVSSRSWDNPSLAVKYRGFRCAFSS